MTDFNSNFTEKIGLTTECGTKMLKSLACNRIWHHDVEELGLGLTTRGVLATEYGMRMWKSWANNRIWHEDVEELG